MTIEFACPYCDTLLRTADERVGWQAKCPACSAIVDIPESAAPQAATADAFDDASRWTEPQPKPGESARTALDATPSARVQLCPMCGAETPVYKNVCPACGEHLRVRQRAPARDGYRREHRAVAILLFAIASWFLCPIFGIVAWIMANEDLAGIRDGSINPDAEIAIRIGQLIAAVNVIAIGSLMLFLCIISMLMGALG